ncbi:MAG: M20/M25/M40 family metallo-hydrolase, partial [Clostridia bacterium]|nr:M20/M25/M40 family metallo-hydrolase [Clostridia bacterium]
FEAASAIREAANMVLEIENMSKKGGVTYNCGIINGGTSANVIPDLCVMEVDIRVSTLDEMAEAEKLMYEAAKRCVVKNTKRKVSVITKRPPMKVTDANLKLLDIWNKSAKNLGLSEFSQLIRGGGSDAAYTVLAGVPTLCSCAAVGYNEHTLDEKLDLSTLCERAALLCEVIKNIGEISL